jgi:hypothetical protein
MFSEKKSPITVERLREVLDYEPDTGVFRWKKVPLRSPVKVGDIAGGASGEGYKYINVDMISVPAQRIAWLYYYGEWPSEQVGHRDGNRSNNAISNLYLIKKMTKIKELTIDRLKSVLDYNPETGDFTWRISSSNRTPVGTKAGAKGTIGYIHISVDMKKYLAHRLAYFYMTGEWPKSVIDHINGDKADNRWANLRPATISQNTWNSNKSSKNSSGYKGVSFSKSKKKWTARISKNYHLHILGYFDTKEEAIEAHKKAAIELHGDFARYTES